MNNEMKIVLMTNVNSTNMHMNNTNMKWKTIMKILLLSLLNSRRVLNLFMSDQPAKGRKRLG